MTMGLARVLCLALLGCGYTPVHSTAPSAPRLGVVLTDVHTGDAVMLEALRFGASQALAARGMLRSDTAYPRLELEMLRLDRISEGVAERGGVPLARAFRIVVTGRARVAVGVNQYAEDTGDVSVAEVRAASVGAQELMLDADGNRAVAQKLGRTLTQKILGEPTVESSP